MEGCVLCSPGLGPVIARSEHWRLVLNRDQDLRGQLCRATSALESAFSPDHFNYAFLQNQDRHVHLHVIPRYAGERRFSGVVFRDTAYPDHYDVSGPPNVLPRDRVLDLAERLRRSLPEGSVPGS